MRLFPVTVVLALVLLVAGCREGSGSVQPSPTPGPMNAASATPSPSPPRTPTPSPTLTPEPTPEVRFRFGVVSADDQALIRFGVDVAARYLEETVGEQASRVAVYADSDFRALSRQFIDVYGSGPLALDFPRRIVFGVAEANIGSVFIYPAATIWQQSNTVQRLRVVVHEYVHVIQFELMGRAVAERVFTTPTAFQRPDGPSWLFEGTAELLSWRAMESAGLTRVQSELAEQRLLLRDSGLTPAELETYLDFLAGGPRSMGMSLLAADFLLRERPESTVIDYYELVRSGLAWETAFERAFGVTPARFYSDFETYQRSGFRS